VFRNPTKVRNLRFHNGIVHLYFYNLFYPTIDQPLSRLAHRKKLIDVDEVPIRLREVAYILNYSLIFRT
jgi:hypothetical protein